MTAVRLVSFAAMLAASVSAQTTTWTSFEDRRGHTMAATPTGGVVMFGGLSVTQPNVTLGDTNRLSTNNQSWSGATDGPQPRSSHAMAATTIATATSYVVFGGLSETGIPTHTTYQYDGTGWHDVTPVNPSLSPPARSGHALATNVGGCHDPRDSGGQLGGRVARRVADRRLPIADQRGSKPRLLSTSAADSSRSARCGACRKGSGSSCHTPSRAPVRHGR